MSWYFLHSWKIFVVVNSRLTILSFSSWKMLYFLLVPMVSLENILCIWVLCLYVYMWNTLRGQIREWEPHGTGVTDNCELPHKWWELNPSPLQEQQVVTLSEPSPQPGLWFLMRNLSLELLRPTRQTPWGVVVHCFKVLFFFCFQKFDHTEFSLLWICLVLFGLGWL